MFGTRSINKVYNFVHADEIWKDHVALELQSQRRWKEQWGYLLGEYQKLQEDLLDIGGDVGDMSDLAKDRKELTEKEDVGRLVPPTHGVEFKIDQLATALGRCMQSNARGKNDIVKVLKWPREGLR